MISYQKYIFSKFELIFIYNLYLQVRSTAYTGLYRVSMHIRLSLMLTVTIRLGFPEPESTIYSLSTLNESESENFNQEPPLKIDSAYFGDISHNRN